jgi:hypothetical protein
MYRFDERLRGSRVEVDLPGVEVFFFHSDNEDIVVSSERQVHLSPRGFLRTPVLEWATDDADSSTTSGERATIFIPDNIRQIIVKAATRIDGDAERRDLVVDERVDR